MRRDQIEASVKRATDAIASGDQQAAVDAWAAIAVDTLLALHTIAASQVSIAESLHLIASEDDLLHTKSHQ